MTSQIRYVLHFILIASVGLFCSAPASSKVALKQESRREYVATTTEKMFAAALLQLNHVNDSLHSSEWTKASNEADPQRLAATKKGMLSANVSIGLGTDNSGATAWNKASTQDLCAQRQLYSAGSLSWLHSESRDGAWAVADQTNGTSFVLLANSNGARISIEKEGESASIHIECGAQTGQKLCQKAARLAASSEVVLGGFALPGNSGAFRVTGVNYTATVNMSVPINVVRIRLGELERASIGLGQVALIAAETSTTGTLVSRFLGPPSRLFSLVSSGNRNNSTIAVDTVRVDPHLSQQGVRAACSEQSGSAGARGDKYVARIIGSLQGGLPAIGTIMKLEGFSWTGNVGAFRVVASEPIASHEGTGTVCVLVEDIRAASPLRPQYLLSGPDHKMQMRVGSAHDSLTLAMPLGSAHVDSVVSCSVQASTTACRQGEKLLSGLRSNVVGLAYMEPVGMDSVSGLPIIAGLQACASPTCQAVLHGLGDAQHDAQTAEIAGVRGSVLILASSLPRDVRQNGWIVDDPPTLAAGACTPAYTFGDRLASNAALVQRTVGWLQSCCSFRPGEVSFVTPSTGPRGGGTWLVVEGQQLGRTVRTSGSIKILIGGVQCNIQRFLWQSKTTDAPWASFACLSPEREIPAVVPVQAAVLRADGRKQTNLVGSFEFVGSAYLNSGLHSGFNPSDELSAVLHTKDWRDEGTAGALVHAAQLAVARERLYDASDHGCAFNCSGNGACQKALSGQQNCDCNPGWVGQQCEWPLLPCTAALSQEPQGQVIPGQYREDPCAPGGVCDGERGRCVCSSAIVTSGAVSLRLRRYGKACQYIECPSGCSGHGTCQVTQGTCDCDKLYLGPDCGSLTNSSLHARAPGSGVSQQPLSSATDNVSMSYEHYAEKWIGIAAIVPDAPERDVLVEANLELGGDTWVGADVHPTSLERFAFSIGLHMYPCEQIQHQLSMMSLRFFASEGNGVHGIDFDGSGCVSAAEFVRAARTAGGSALRSLLDTLADTLDADQNGEISPWEVSLGRIRQIDDVSAFGVMPGLLRTLRVASSAAEEVSKASDNATEPTLRFLRDLSQRSAFGFNSDVSTRAGSEFVNHTQLLQWSDLLRGMLRRSGPGAASSWMQVKPMQVVTESNTAFGQPSPSMNILPTDGVIAQAWPHGWLLGAWGGHGGKAGEVQMSKVARIDSQVAAGDIVMPSIGAPLMIKGMVGLTVSASFSYRTRISVPHSTVFPLFKLRSNPAIPIRLSGEMSIQLGQNTESGVVIADVSRQACNAARVAAIIDMSGGTILSIRDRTDGQRRQQPVRSQLIAYGQVAWRVCTGKRPVIGLSSGNLQSKLRSSASSLRLNLQESGQSWLIGVVAHMRTRRGGMASVQPLPFGAQLLDHSGSRSLNRSLENSASEARSQFVFRLVASQPSQLWTGAMSSLQEALNRSSLAFEAEGWVDTARSSSDTFNLAPESLVRLAQSALQLGDQLMLGAPVGPCTVLSAYGKGLVLQPLLNVLGYSGRGAVESSLPSGRLFRIGAGQVQVASTYVQQSQQMQVLRTNSLVLDGSQCLDALQVEESDDTPIGSRLCKQQAAGKLYSPAGSMHPPLVGSGDILQVSSSGGLTSSVALSVDKRRQSPSPVCEVHHRVVSRGQPNSRQKLSAVSIDVVRPLAGQWVHLPGFWREAEALDPDHNLNASVATFEFSGDGAHLFVHKGDTVLVRRRASQIGELASVKRVGHRMMQVIASIFTSQVPAESGGPLDDVDPPLSWGSSVDSFDALGRRGWFPSMRRLSLPAHRTGSVVFHVGDSCDTRVSSGIVPIAVSSGYAAATDSQISAEWGIVADASFQARYSSSHDQSFRVSTGPRFLSWEAISLLVGMRPGKTGPSSVVGAAFADDVATTASLSIASIERAAASSRSDGRLSVHEVVSGITSKSCLANESPIVEASPCSQAAVYGLGVPASYSALFWPVDRENYVWCATVSTYAGASVPSDCLLLGQLDDSTVGVDADQVAGLPYALASGGQHGLLPATPGDRHKLHGFGDFGYHQRPSTQSQAAAKGGSASSAADGPGIEGVTGERDSRKSGDAGSSGHGRRQGTRSTTMSTSQQMSSSSSSGSSGGEDGFSPEDTDKPEFPPRPALQPYKEKPHDVMPGFFYFPSPFIWCPMIPPFLIPFCPTPIPQINILLKMMIPGVIRPPIDQILADFMVGVDATQQIFLCMFPMMDAGGARRGPPGLIQLQSGLTHVSEQSVESPVGLLGPLVGSGARRWGLGNAASNALVQLDASHIASFEVHDRARASTTLEHSGSSSMHTGLVTPALKKQLAGAVSHPIANDVAAVIASNVHLQSHAPLVARLAGAVRDETLHACSSDVSDGIGIAAAAAIGGGLSAASGRGSSLLADDIASISPASMVPVLSTSVAQAVAEGLLQDTHDLDACAACHATRSQSDCDKCSNLNGQRSSSGVATEWASVLSRRIAVALMRGQHELRSVPSD